MMFIKSQRGWHLLWQATRTFQKEKKLLLLPFISSSFYFLFFSAITLLTGYMRLKGFDMRTLPTVQIIMGYAAILVIFFFINVIAGYFDTALITCLNHYDAQKKPLLSKGLSSASRLFPKIFLWILTQSTIGIFAIFFPKKIKKIKFLHQQLSGLSWQFACFMVFFLLIERRQKIWQTIRTSSQKMHDYAGEAPKLSFSISLITFLGRLLALIPSFVGYYIGQSPWIIIGISTTVILLFIQTVWRHAAMLTIQRAIYVYIVHQKIARNFNEMSLSTAIVPGKL